MYDNGMGGRRIGKRYYDNELGNIEETTDYWSQTSHDEWVDLIESYNNHNKLIKQLKTKWLEPKERRKK